MLCTALSVSVICNMYLVCAALKLVILTFKIFTFCDDFVYGTAVVFFRYLNVYSNFLLVVKSCLHFGIIMIYNVRVRHLVKSTVLRWCPILQSQPEDYDDNDDDEDGDADEDETKKDLAGKDEPKT